MTIDIPTLIEKLKSGSGPDRGLDALIMVATVDSSCDAEMPAHEQEAPSHCYLLDQGLGWVVRTAPELTASVDACLALLAEVLPGSDWNKAFTGDITVCAPGHKLLESQHDDLPYAFLIAILTAVDAQNE